jgi:hypothetical protein
MLLPPEDPPKKLRGTTVHVSFWISASGRVERIEVDPEIQDRDYAQKMREKLMSFTFQPARSPAGAAIPSRWDASIDF